MEYKLNKIKGIPVITIKDNNKKYVYVEFRVNYGTFSEEVPEMAHLIEHWLILGTDKYPSRKDTYNAIEEIGGSMNAYTTNMQTGYYAKVPSSKLRIAIDVLSQIFFHPLIAEESIEYAKEPINVELSGRRRDMWYQLGVARNRSMFMKDSKAYTRLITERLESTKNITREQAYETYKKSYVNPNISIGIGGSFDEEELMNLLEQSIEERDGDELIIEPKLELKEEIRILDIKNNMISLTFKLPEGSGEGEILNSLIGGRSSARVPSLIRTEKNLSYATGSWFADQWDDNILSIYSDCKIGDDKLVENLILEECRKIANGEVTEEDFRVAKQSIIGKKEIKEEMGSLVRDVLDNLRVRKELYSLDYDIEDINKVNFEQFKEYLSKIDFSKFAVAKILAK